MRTGGKETPALLYSLVPLLLWAALRLGLKGVCTSMFLVAFLSIWGAARDRGPFRGQEPFNNELSLQLFLFFAAIPFMVLAVLAEQQKQAEGDRIQMLEAIAHLNRVASMGQMAASLAHELAQPLASILNNAQAGTQFASQPEPNVEEIRGAFADIIEEDRRARVPGELLILGDFRHFAIHGSRSARRSRSVHSVVAESVLGEYPRYPATRSFEAGDIKPGSGRHQAAAGV